MRVSDSERQDDLAKLGPHLCRTAACGWPVWGWGSVALCLSELTQSLQRGVVGEGGSGFNTREGEQEEGTEQGIDWQEPRPGGLSVSWSPAQGLDSHLCGINRWADD